MGSQPPVEGESRQPQQPPHVVMVPYPAQAHVTPMLQLAKLLHTRGYHVTFVNNEFNHRRHLPARGPGALDGAPGFRFATIDDGLPRTDADATQDVPALCYSTMTTCLPRFKDLVARTNAEGRPAVTCVVADSIMTFALPSAAACPWCASWPFFAEQQTNFRYKRTEWSIGMEIGNDVRRAEVEALIREAMEREKGREMRRRVRELKKSAVAAARPDGRSMRNVDRLIDEVLQPLD